MSGAARPWLGGAEVPPAGAAGTLCRRFPLECRLIVEVDGGQHNDLRIEADRARTRHLEALGYRVIRFWNPDVLRNLEGVLAMIAEAAEGR